MDFMKLIGAMAERGSRIHEAVTRETKLVVLNGAPGFDDLDRRALEYVFLPERMDDFRWAVTNAIAIGLRDRRDLDSVMPLIAGFPAEAELARYLVHRTGDLRARLEVHLKERLAPLIERLQAEAPDLGTDDEDDDDE